MAQKQLTLPDLDETDIAILDRVEQNNDINLEELAETLDLSKSAVHYRLSKLKDNDIITSITANVDPLMLGLNMMIITDVSVSHERGYADEVGTQLADVDGVNQIYYTMGDVDFVVISRVQNRDQMNKLLDDIVKIDAVDETSSRFVMDEHKTGGNTIGDMSEEMIATVIGDDE